MPCRCLDFFFHNTAAGRVVGMTSGSPSRSPPAEHVPERETEKNKKKRNDAARTRLTLLFTSLLFIPLTPYAVYKSRDTTRSTLSNRPPPPSNDDNNKMPAPKIAGTIRSKNPLKGAVEVLPVRTHDAQRGFLQSFECLRCVSHTLSATTTSLFLFRVYHRMNPSVGIHHTRHDTNRPTDRPIHVHE